jgi:hypothetical protein
MYDCIIECSLLILSLSRENIPCRENCNNSTANTNNTEHGEERDMVVSSIPTGIYKAFCLNVQKKDTLVNFCSYHICLP